MTPAVTSSYADRLRDPGAAGLYLHVPFCVRKCAYCDFASRATEPGDPRMARYVDSLIEQIGRCAGAGLLAHTDRKSVV